MAITKRGLHRRRDSLQLNRKDGVLYWKKQAFWCTVSLPLLQLVDVRRSGCMLNLLTSETDWCGLAASVQLILDCEADAVMLQDTLLQLVSNANTVAQSASGCKKGFILYMA